MYVLKKEKYYFLNIYQSIVYACAYLVDTV